MGVIFKRKSGDYMANEFKKLIRKEFGENCYYKYFFSYQSLLYNDTYDIENVENDEVYKDIHGKLINMDFISLKKMQKRLSETMLMAFSISKSYLLVLACYMFAIYLFFTQSFDPTIVKVSVSFITTLFIYKTYEFIANKFCYIDAHIVIIYKTVLDNIIESRISPIDTKKRV